MSTNKFYENGQIKEEVEYIDNLKNGRVRWYYPDGTLRGAGFYIDGRCDGDFITYYRSGKIKSRVNYREGEPISLIEYFEDEPKKKIVTIRKNMTQVRGYKNSKIKKLGIIVLVILAACTYTIFNLLDDKNNVVEKTTKNMEVNKNVVVVKKVEEVKKVTSPRESDIEILKIEPIKENIVIEKNKEIEEKINSIKTEPVVENFNPVEKKAENIEKAQTKKIELSVTKLQELQQQTKIQDKKNIPLKQLKAERKERIDLKKRQLLQELKTDIVNINYSKNVTVEQREEVLKGILKPKYKIYKDEKYGYKVTYPYNILEIANFQTKYLRGKAFSSKGGYLLGKLMVIPSKDLKELKVFSIQQLFENELISKYPIIKKDINNRSYEIKLQANNKILERYVVLSQNGDYYLFLTMEYNSMLDKDLKKIIQKMKKGLEGN